MFELLKLLKHAMQTVYPAISFIAETLIRASCLKHYFGCMDLELNY